MASPQRNAEKFMELKGRTTEHMDCIQKSQEKLQSLSVEDTAETLLSRIDEQSSLICILKHRADELLPRYEAQQKINTELEGRLTDCQRERDGERKKAQLIEKRFMDLAANNQAIIAFMVEHKNHNAQLKLANKKLQSENDSLFSQKLQEKEVYVQKLLKDIIQLREKQTKVEKEYREKFARCQSKLLEQATEHQAKEASLIDQLHNAQKQQRDVVEMCQDLKLKLQKAEEEHALKANNMRESITRLTKEKDKLISLSMERGKVIQEKQDKIQQLEIKWKEEKKALVEAEDRFEREAEAVNADLKVTSLQSALDESTQHFRMLKKDYEAFKEHSTKLLTQERELNKKRLYITG